MLCSILMQSSKVQPRIHWHSHHFPESSNSLNSGHILTFTLQNIRSLRRQLCKNGWTDWDWDTVWGMD